jgi:hypothetical protein
MRRERCSLRRALFVESTARPEKKRGLPGALPGEISRRGKILDSRFKVQQLTDQRPGEGATP